MALQLELSTQKATKALQNFDKALYNTEKKLTAFNTAMKGAGSASTQFASGAKSASSSLRSVGSAASKATSSTGAYANSARAATTATRGLGGAANFAKSTLLGFGVALGGMGLANFTKGVFDTVTAMQQLKGQMDAAIPNTNAGAKALEFVTKTAEKTATDIDALTKSYRTFASNSLNSGMALKDVNNIFESIAVSVRGMGLKTEQTKRVFMGFQQIVSKGSFSMEELRQQIGENISVLPLLAKAMGVTDAELQKMLAKGEVGLENLKPLADLMRKTYGPALANQMKTPLAALTLLSNQFTLMKKTFGEPLFDAMVPALNRLTKSFKDMNEGSNDAMANFGTLIGTVLGGAIDIFRILAENIDLVSTAVIALIGYWATMKTINIATSLWETGKAAATAAQGLMGMTKSMQAINGMNVAATVGANATAFQRLGTALKFVGGVLGKSVLYLGLMAAAYAAVMVATGKTEQLMKEIGDVLDWLLGLIGTNTAEVYEWIKSWQAWYNQLTFFEDAAKMIGSWIDWIVQKYNELDKAYSDMVNAVRNGLSDAWDYVANAAQGAINSVMNWINRAIDRVREWINVLKQVLGMSGGGGGGGNTQVPSAAIGGISHMMHRTNPSQSVSAAAFKNAPHFAKGGVTGPFGAAGIPAILHPNEAVIPLQNGAVPVSINGGSDIASTVAQALQQVAASGNLGGKTLTIKGSRGTETISMSQLDDLQEFIAFGEQWARARRQRQANKWDLAASYMMTGYQNTAEKYKYGGFTTKGSGMSGGDGKTYGVPKNFGADKRYGSVGGSSGVSASGFGTPGSGKYGEDVQVLNVGAGWSSGNAVTTIPAQYLNADYYKDIRPDFDYAGNTGLGWDIPAGYSMKHYKAAFGATLMGTPLTALPGSTPGGMVHKNASYDRMDEGTKTRIGMAQMSQGAAYAGLAMWKAMKDQGAAFETRAAKAYALGKKDALNPPGIRKLKMGSLTGVERAVRAGKTIEAFMQEKGIQQYVKTQGGYAKNPRYAQVMQEWTAAAEKLTDWSTGGSMGAGANISNLGEGVSGRGMFGVYKPVTDAMAQQFGFKDAKAGQKALRDAERSSMTKMLNGMGMASGTANTSNDPRFKRAPAVGDGRGGRMVTIHPDEAVIPLKNGKVPIAIGNRAMGIGSDSMGGGGSSGGPVTVNMTIHAKDVESFRRSQPQLIQDLAFQMRQVNQQIGTPAGEDLTKITNAPPKKY